jgi:hypothetical protein
MGVDDGGRGDGAEAPAPGDGQGVLDESLLEEGAFIEKVIEAPACAGAGGGEVEDLEGFADIGMVSGS